MHPAADVQSQFLTVMHANPVQLMILGSSLDVETAGDWSGEGFHVNVGQSILSDMKTPSWNGEIRRR